MLELPSRDSLSELRHAIDAVMPTAIVGLARAIDDARVQMLFWHAHGIGSYSVSIEDVPDVLRPSASCRGVASDRGCAGGIGGRFEVARAKHDRAGSSARALQQVRGGALGMTRHQLYVRMKRYGLD